MRAVVSAAVTILRGVAFVTCGSCCSLQSSGRPSRSLLERTAAHAVACALYESQYVEKVEKGKQDISKALEVLEPNRS